MDQWLDFSDFFDQVQELIDLNLYDEAKGMLDRYARTFESEWELHLLYSRLYTEQNKPRQSLPYLHEGLRLEPGNADCLLGLFYAHSMLHQMDEAGKWLIEAERRHPDNELILSACIWYYSESGRHKKALTFFERARAKGTTNPETFRNAGIAFDRLGDFNNAEECFVTALQLHPQYDEVREMLSDLYIGAGKTEQAVELYQKALEDSPRNIRYLSRLIFCLSQSQEPDKAVGVARESIRIYPNSPIGYIDLAYTHLNSERLEDALAAANSALDIAPLDAESHRARAIILSEMGSDTEAEKEFETALSFDPENIETMRDLYQHYRQTGNFAKMEEVLFKVLKKEDSSSVDDYWFLADYYKEKKEHARALRYFHKAYKIRPGEYDLLALIAEVLIEKKHTRLAQRFMKKYVDAAGWNEVTAQMADYPELRKRRNREGMQFLRFYGSKSTDFYRHVFLNYFARLIIASLAAVALTAAVPVYLLSGRTGITWLVVISLLLFGTAAMVNHFRGRNKAAPY